MSRCCLLAAVSLISVAGCADSATDRRDRPPIRVVIGENTSADTILLVPFQAPAKFGLPFTTYVPADMDARPSRGDEEYVRFGPADATAFIHVFIHPPGTTSQRAQNVVETFAASRGVPVSESETVRAPFSEEGLPPEAGTFVPPRFEWALLEVPYAYNCVVVTAGCAVGRIALGRHGDRYFHVVVQYPPGAASFMRPRVAEIFRHWRWVQPR